MWLGGNVHCIVSGYLGACYTLGGVDRSEQASVLCFHHDRSWSGVICIITAVVKCLVAQMVIINFFTREFRVSSYEVWGSSLLNMSVCAAGWALCGHEVAAGAAIQPAVDVAAQRPPHTSSWEPASLFTRQERLALGGMCKQLIDAGRCAWLEQQLDRAAATRAHHSSRIPDRCLQQQHVQQVAYVPSTFTGENTLILVQALAHDTTEDEEAQ